MNKKTYACYYWQPSASNLIIIFLLAPMAGHFFNGANALANLGLMGSSMRLICRSKNLSATSASCETAPNTLKN